MVCDSSAAALEDLVQQCDSAVRWSGVITECRREPRLGVEDATEAEQLILDLVDLAFDLGALQQGQSRRVLDSVDQVRFRGPSLGHGRPQ